MNCFLLLLVVAFDVFYSYSISIKTVNLGHKNLELLKLAYK